MLKKSFLKPRLIEATSCQAPNRRSASVPDRAYSEKQPCLFALHLLKALQWLPCLPRQGRLWVSARGDLDNPTGERAPGLYVLTPLSPDLDEVDIDILDYACSVMQICGDSLFYIHSSSLPDASNFIFGIIDVNTQKQVTDCFVEASSAETYKMPYGLLVNPYNRQLFVTDAKNYVSSGVLHCYDPAGKELWQVRTGDIPSRMVFLYK